MESLSSYFYNRKHCFLCSENTTPSIPWTWTYIRKMVWRNSKFSAYTEKMCALFRRCQRFSLPSSSRMFSAGLLSCLSFPRKPLARNLANKKWKDVKSLMNLPSFFLQTPVLRAFKTLKIIIGSTRSMGVSFTTRTYSVYLAQICEIV